MSPTDTLPDDGKPTIDAMLKNADWETRLAEARVKREAVLAAKAQAKAQEQARAQAIEHAHEQAAPAGTTFRNTARVRKKPAEVSTPPTSLRHQNAPQVQGRRWQRRLAIIAGLGICSGMTALVLWRAFG